jgi:hypothetical protein
MCQEKTKSRCPVKDACTLTYLIPDNNDKKRNRKTKPDTTVLLPEIKIIAFISYMDPSTQYLSVFLHYKRYLSIFIQLKNTTFK